VIKHKILQTIPLSPPFPSLRGKGKNYITVFPQFWDIEFLKISVERSPVSSSSLCGFLYFELEEWPRLTSPSPITAQLASERHRHLQR